ncbi:helix-turn-helix domain-containing protein [Pectinatus frisingensis]|uniref:helix-turn-helix domain-containing protein n=1 Tax=Pectinatus frisingensis TaxID=865 RepID=UPI0018C7B00F|nr:helix-turn-helix domain-containing protein [Pectinatus frisingensis]
MFKHDIDSMFDTLSGEWNKKIAFSPKEVSEMLGIPVSTIAQYCREGKLKVFKVGRHFRIARADLYYFIEDSKDKCLII